MKNSNCPVCGAHRLEEKMVEKTFTYKGRSITISDYLIYKCGECGEEMVVDKYSPRKSEKALIDFSREVDELLTGVQIKRIRRKLGFTQEQMAELFGGGLKSFAKYETGKVCQSRAMDNLLRILDANPEVIKVLLKSEEHSSEGSRGVNLEERKNKSAHKEKRRLKPEKCTA
jgi:HTH-type transcriptional regulator/antitoxin MqsA